MRGEYLALSFTLEQPKQYSFDASYALEIGETENDCLVSRIRRARDAIPAGANLRQVRVRAHFLISRSPLLSKLIVAYHTDCLDL